MKTAEAPFPFTSMFQNGPRRQGSAPQTLFKPGKDFPPPRKNRAPLPAPGRSENLALEKGKGANAKPKPFSVRSLLPPPFGRHRRHPVMLTRPRNPKIRSPPLDDVNNLRHHCKCQRRFASTAIQIRRNALFTSSEYARNRQNSDLQACRAGTYCTYGGWRGPSIGVWICAQPCSAGVWQVVGLYIATLFVIWQVINLIAFRTFPSLPIVVGGTLIIAGGLIVTFWKPASE